MRPCSDSEQVADAQVPFREYLRSLTLCGNLSRNAPTELSVVASNRRRVWFLIVNVSSEMNFSECEKLILGHKLSKFQNLFFRL